MRKYLVTACLGCLFFANAFSQTNASSSSNGLSPTDTSSQTNASSRSVWKFRSVEYAGMLFGQAGNYGQLQTINGVCKGSWFLGAGLGLDFYRFRSIPVFLSVTKDLMPAKNGFFVSLDAGTNFPWYKRPEGFYDGTFFTSKFVAGPFWTAGLGYKIKLSPHGGHALSLLGGYSYKKLHEDAEDANNIPNIVRYNYGNKTWSLKIGLIL